jgi:PAS domain S-box-containing protein
VSTDPADLLRSALDAIPNLVGIKDADGRYTLVNRALAESFGTTPGAMLGRTEEEIGVPAGSFAEWLRIDREVMATQCDAFVPEEIFIDGDGHERWFQTHKRAIIDSDGVARQVLLISTDVTARREAQAAANEAQRLARVGSWTHDLAANQVTWSTELLRQMGYDTDVVPTFQRFIDRIHPDDRERVIAIAGHGFAMRSAFEYEVRHVNAEGVVTGIYLERGQPVFDANCIAIRMIGTSQDITAQKATERALVAAQKSEDANLAKSEFMANMSHELRTPLNSVIGFADVLRKNKTGTFAPRDLEYLDRIRASGRHLLGLIDCVLDLSRIESGKVELEITPVPVVALVAETLAELESQAHAAGVCLRGSYPDGPAVLDADRGKLRRVLLNLVDNAVKFSMGGEVWVVVAVDPVNGWPARIEVTDHGIGIPSESLESIFDAFQQAESSTARRFGGTGLGLTISRALARRMGFDITVTSEVGRGSTFTIDLAPPAPAASTIRATR